MSTPDPSPDEPLDFSAPATETGPVTCTACKQEIADQYWTAGPAVICEHCKTAVEQGQQAETDVASRTGRFGRALVYGLGGMLAGAAIWYAVAKLANLEVGLIAILLGYLVGRAVFIGSGRRGGRRYQVLAVVLTYLGIGTAYVPFAVEAAREGSAEVAAASDSSTTLLADSAHPIAEMSSAELTAEAARLDSAVAAAESRAQAPREASTLGLLLGVGIGIAAIFTLPVLLVVGGFPGSVISILIYGFAIMQAWKLTQAARLDLAGPFRVGATEAA